MAEDKKKDAKAPAKGGAKPDKGSDKKTDKKTEAKAEKKPGAKADKKSTADKKAGAEKRPEAAPEAAVLPVDYVPRLKKHYDEVVKPKLIEQFGYKNVMEVPRLDKIVLNMGIGEATADSKLVQVAVGELEKIA